MAYILHTIGGDIGPEELLAAHDRYNEYLETLRDKLPSAAFAFATAAWHYNAEDPRCLHDAWLESLTIKECTPDPQDLQRRHVELHARFINAYENGHIELVYKQVREYNLAKRFDERWWNQGHRDWLIDEIRLSERGLVLHEIRFDGARWLIECEDIEHRWLPFGENVETKG